MSVGNTLKYKCSGCGQVHEGIPHVVCKAPCYYDGASPEDREKNFKLTSDTCVMKEGDDTHYFVRAAMLMPIRGTDVQFGWGIWVSLSEKNFNRYLALRTDEEIAAEPAYFGWFANNIGEDYPDATRLKCRVDLQPGNKRPLVTLEPTEHPLSREQREGMSVEQVAKILSSLEHLSEASAN